MIQLRSLDYAARPTVVSILQDDVTIVQEDEQQDLHGVTLTLELFFEIHAALIQAGYTPKENT